MSNIIKLSNSDTDKIRLVEKSLIGLRECYPGFQKWFNEKIIPNIRKDRDVFLSYNSDGFTGAMILKNTDSEKKVCTLFVKDKYRYNKLGSDLLRIASEELETYKLPITISSEAIESFINSDNFNFYTENIKDDFYKKGMKEYFGYIMFHNSDNMLKKI